MIRTRACRRALCLGLALGLALGAAPGRAGEAPQDPPYAAAVARRFPAPDVAYDTPGLQPGRSAWTDNAELAERLRSLADAGAATLAEVGRSEAGTPLWALFFTRAADPAAAPGRRPVVLLVGQQHGNEPAGAEALLVVAQRLADASSPLAAVLARVDVVVLPRANPDGAMLGRRRNAAGLDINRDHLRLQTPEAQALAALMQRLRPVLVVDVHEFVALSRHLPRFGGLKAHDMLLQYATTPNLPPALTQAAEAGFRAPLLQALADAGLRTEWYYTNPADEAALRLSMGGLQPDLARNAGGLRHAVSILLESRGFDLGRHHALRRVHSHVVAVGSLLASAAAQADTLQALQARLDAEVAAMACQGEITLTEDHGREWRPLLLLDPETGADKPVLVEWRSALHRLPLATRQRPCGYWLAADAGQVVQRLHRLGVQVRTLPADQTLSIERYRPTALADGPAAGAGSPLPGPRQVSVALERGSMGAPAGSFYVPLAQPLAHLVVAALEPDTPSSWFSHHLVGRLDMVRRVLAPP